jgi:hypothetical protein
MATDKMQENLLAFIKSEHMDKTAEYLGRGRKFAAVEPAELTRMWKASWEARTADPHNGVLVDLCGDLEVEHELRGIEPPYDEVKPHLEAFYAAVTDFMEKQKAEDPEHFEEDGGVVVNRFRGFLAKVAKPDS